MEKEDAPVLCLSDKSPETDWTLSTVPSASHGAGLHTSSARGAFFGSLSRCMGLAKILLKSSLNLWAALYKNHAGNK